MGETGALNAIKRVRTGMNLFFLSLTALERFDSFDYLRRYGENHE